MKNRFIPEYRFDKFNMATPDFLISIGARGVLLDVDNTLEPYENPEPTDRVLEWLQSLRKAGIKTAIVSNNGRERIERFNNDLKMPAYYKAGKPFKANLIRAMKDIGCEPRETVFIGDQILTDVLAAHNAGIRAILVPPIKDKKDPFTRFKRVIEGLILKKQRREIK